MVVLKHNGDGNKVILNTYNGLAYRDGRWQELEGVNILFENRQGQRKVVMDTSLLDPRLASIIRADWLTRYGPQGTDWLHEVHGPTIP
jgi:hypothetical protein